MAARVVHVQPKDRIDIIYLEGLDLKGNTVSIGLFPEELEVLRKSDRDVDCGHLKALDVGGDQVDCGPCSFMGVYDGIQ